MYKIHVYNYINYSKYNKHFNYQYYFNMHKFFITEVRIANHSTEFVNKVLDNIKNGISDGGIDNF